MVLTEDEAKQKWCPFARVGSQLGGSYNRDTQGVPPVDRCIASECMAWRWITTDENGDPVIADREFGYCGLADKP